MSKSFTLTPENAATVFKVIHQAIKQGLESAPVVVTLGRVKRTLAQNAKQWPMLEDIADQVEHFGRRYSKEDWKHICTAGFKGQELVPGINGQLVALPGKTSGYEKGTFSEYIEFLYWWGQENGVVWSEKAIDIYNEYREAA